VSADERARAEVTPPSRAATVPTALTRGPAKPPVNPPVSSDAYTVMGYVIAGPVFYGGVGWLLDRWLHQAWLVPTGVVLGMTLALLFVYLRFGRM